MRRASVRKAWRCLPCPRSRSSPQRTSGPSTTRSRRSIVSTGFYHQPPCHRCGLRRRSWSLARQKALPTLRVAAVGKATAARLSELGVTPDLVSPDGRGASLAASMIEVLSRTSGGQRSMNGAVSPTESSSLHRREFQLSVPQGGRRTLAGVRVLWPRSDIARRELPETLRNAGAEVVEPTAYRTVPAGPGGSVEEFLRQAAGRHDRRRDLHVAIERPKPVRASRPPRPCDRRRAQLGRQPRPYDERGAARAWCSSRSRVSVENGRRSRRHARGLPRGSKGHGLGTSGESDTR